VGKTTQAIIECNQNTVGQVCESDDSACTVQGICTRVGQNVFCSGEDMAPDGTPCESDGQPCTADACMSGVCQNTPLPEGTLCSNGQFCVTNETCTAGVCGGGEPFCDDGNECTMDVCDEAADMCGMPVPLEGNACDDGDACTTGTTCDSAADCVGGSQVDCSDGDQCTEDLCDSTTGCSNPIAEDLDCDDGLFCSVGETCSVDGSCEGTLGCIDGNPCTIDSCDEVGDQCIFTPDEGAQCDDGNTCTESETCQSDGSCVGTPVADDTVCTEAGGCQLAGTCQSGVCTGTTPAPDETVCDDGDLCTELDECAAGSCVGQPRVCFDGDPCTIDGCDPASGCVFEPVEGCGGAADAGPDAGGVDSGIDAGLADSDSGTGPGGVLGGGGCGGCQTQRRGGGPLWLFVVVLVLMRRKSAASVALVLAIAVPGAAMAQGFDAEIFRPATSRTAFFSQPQAEVLDAGDFNVSATFNVASEPLVLRDPDTHEPIMDGVVVSSRSGAQLAAALGLLGSIELSAALPVLMSQSGNGALLSGAPDLDGGALGDARFGLKARLLNGETLSLGASLGASVPTGDEESFGGAESASGTARVLLSMRAGALTLGANAGYLIRKRSRVGDLVVDDEIVAGAGASVAIMPRKLWALAEVYTNIARSARRGESMPAETVAGLRYAVAGPWMVQGAVGVGIGNGYGTPRMRGVLSLAYAPLAAAAETLPPPPPPVVVKKKPPPPPKDSDGDGLLDPDDECPQEAEDKDGFEDENGCPDPDNDGDRIADVDDACPDEAEVMNGIKDQDGCPDKGLIVMVENRVVVGEKVLFKTARARVKRAGRKTLEAIIELFNQHPEWDRIVIEGHADSRGTSEYNQWLSEKRARKTRDAMVKLGMPADKIEAVGFGESRPLMEGKTDEAMQKNRRVEFVMIEKKQELREAPDGQKAGPEQPESPQPPPADASGESLDDIPPPQPADKGKESDLVAPEL
jgi:outer membrane protein OmpA-like peptidoglycan-associated protein